MKLVYKSLSDSSDNGQGEEEKKEEFSGYLEIIGSEEKMIKDILNNNTSKKKDKMFITMQGLEISINSMAGKKEFGMPESTFQRKEDSLEQMDIFQEKKDQMK